MEIDKKETMLVYAFDIDGKYDKDMTLDYTDRSPISGTWQIPGYCTQTKPPAEKEGFDRRWDGST